MESRPPKKFGRRTNKDKREEVANKEKPHGIQIPLDEMKRGIMVLTTKEDLQKDEGAGTHQAESRHDEGGLLELHGFR